MRMLGVFLATVVLFLPLADETSAQTAAACVLPDTPEDASELAQALACIKEKAEAAAFAVANQEDLIAALRQQIADARIAQSNLEAEFKPFREAIGAVVAFDRSDAAAGGACPEGWSYFEPAGGRMIVGAGREHENRDVAGNPLAKYAAFSDDMTQSKANAVGGEERHLLTEAEMPSHSHAFSGHPVTKGNAVPDLASPRPLSTGGAVDRGSYAPAGDISAAGGNQPHNNMPPYVALYYCKRD